MLCLVDFSATKVGSVDSSLELILISSGVFSSGSTGILPRHCVSGQRGLIQKVEATLWLGHRIEELFATGLLVRWHLGLF